MFPESTLFSLSPLLSPGHLNGSLRLLGHLPAYPSAFTPASYTLPSSLQPWHLLKVWFKLCHLFGSHVPVVITITQVKSRHHTVAAHVWLAPLLMTSPIIPPGSKPTGHFLSLEHIKCVYTPGPLHLPHLALGFSLLRSLHVSLHSGCSSNVTSPKATSDHIHNHYLLPLLYFYLDDVRYVKAYPGCHRHHCQDMP